MVTPETLRCQSVCCCKYLLQLNEQRRCLHSNTHLEDKWICTVQKGDKCHRRGRLRLWYLFVGIRQNIPSRERKGWGKARQPAHSFIFVMLSFYSFLLFMLSFPLHPPPPFYSSFLQLPQLLALPHLSFFHLLHPIKLTSSVSRSTDTCPRLHQEPPPDSGRDG